MATNIPTFNETLPSREADPDRELLAQKLYRFFIYLADTFIPYWNTGVQEVEENMQTTQEYKNTTLGYKNETESHVTTTLGYRNEAETFKDLAASIGNYKGVWSAGAFGQGESVKHVGYIWLSDIVDNTSEPGAANWTALFRVIDKKTIYADHTAVNGEYLKTYASAASITITLRTASEDDEIIVDPRDITNNTTIVSENGEDFYWDENNIDTEVLVSGFDKPITFVWDSINNFWRVR